MTEIDEAIREVFAKWRRHDHMQLHAGEMTAQEKRSVVAVLNAVEHEARAVLEAAMPVMVARVEKAEQQVADAYQIVGGFADEFDVHDHPEVVRAMDWLAYGKTEDGSDILPWPREPLRSSQEGESRP